MITDMAGVLRDLAEKLQYKGPHFDPEDDFDPPLGEITIEASELNTAIWKMTLIEVAEFLEAGTEHYVVITKDGWSIQHALGCREEYEGVLTDCPYHEWFQNDLFVEAPGRYRMTYVDDVDNSGYCGLRLEKVDD